MRSGTSWNRRDFLGVTGAGLMMAACSKSAEGGGGEVPKTPQPGAPREGDIALTRGAAMPTRRLGRTGQNVSIIGLGGFHVGLPSDDQEGVRIVRRAVDHGVTFLDNCWDYNNGKSEERMGKALRDGYREKVFLMTKLDGRTKEAAAGQLEQSLRRLQTDVIDLVQIHEVIRMDDPGRVFSDGGAIEALLEAKKAGKIRFIGFTGHKDPSIHLQMIRTGLAHGFVFDTVQMPLNVMDAHYRSFEKEVLPVALEHDMGIIGMKPMGSGIILQSGVVSAPECLRYSLSLPTSVVVTGCETVGVLDQALEAALTFKPFSPDETSQLLSRTAQAAEGGRFEKFKTTQTFDGTEKNRHWLEQAKL